MSDQEVTRLQEQIKTLFNNDARLENEIKECNSRMETGIEKLAQKLDQYSNRLPPWATILIATLTAACGWFAGH